MLSKQPIYSSYKPITLKLQGYSKNDCTVRAIGNALGLSYDLALRVLQRTQVKYNGEISIIGRKLTKGEFSSSRNYLRLVSSFAAEHEKLADLHDIFNSSSNPRRSSKYTKLQTFEDFAATHNKGAYIVTGYGHTAAIVDGIIVDHEDSNSNYRVMEYAKINLRSARAHAKKVAKLYKIDNDENIINLSEVKERILKKSYKAENQVEKKVKEVISEQTKLSEVLRNVGEVIELNGCRYSILGLNSRARKYKVQLSPIGSDSIVCGTASFVYSALKNKKKANI